MKAMHVILALCLSALAACAMAADKSPPEMKADAFRFLRTEMKTFPALTKKDKPTTVIYGIFAFRYSHPTPLKFWGFDEPKGQDFAPRFTQYTALKQDKWEPVRIGYCGTGAMSYELQPGMDYEFRISMLSGAWEERVLADAAKTVQLRVSAETPDGIFWSEPFTHPKP